MPDLKNIQQLDLNLLKVFEQLYLLQNMTRAADVLHLTPSAVSHAVARLRDCLGDPLFVRSQNRMVPTPACQRVAPLLIENLSRLRQILHQWDQFDASTSQQHFRIGMHDALELSILPRLSALLSQQAPNVTFSSIKIDRQHMVRELSSGQVDLALDVALPLKPPVKHQLLVEDGFCVLINTRHPMAKDLSVEAYLQGDHVSVSNRPIGPSVEDLVLQQQGYQRRITMRCQNYLAASQIVANSMRLLTLPVSLARQLKSDALAILPMPVSIPPLTTHMYWHENIEEDSAHSWLRGLFVDQLMR